MGGDESGGEGIGGFFCLKLLAAACAAKCAGFGGKTLLFGLGLCCDGCGGATCGLSKGSADTPCIPKDNYTNQIYIFVIK